MLCLIPTSSSSEFNIVIQGLARVNIYPPSMSSTGLSRPEVAVGICQSPVNTVQMTPGTEACERLR